MPPSARRPEPSSKTKFKSCPEESDTTILLNPVGALSTVNTVSIPEPAGIEAPEKLIDVTVLPTA